MNKCIYVCTYTHMYTYAYKYSPAREGALIVRTGACLIQSRTVSHRTYLHTSHVLKMRLSSRLHVYLSSFSPGKSKAWWMPYADADTRSV